VTVAISGRAPTLSEAFERTALALLARAVDPDGIEERDRREVRAHGPTAEALLAQWLNECLYVLEVEAFACRRVEFAVFDVSQGGGAEPMRLHAFLYGEEIDPGRHRILTDLPAIRTDAVAISATVSGYEIEVRA
jgi:SHS2 domain-containing protein